MENPFPSICEPVAPLTWSPHLCTFDFIFKVEKLLSLSLAGERSGKFSFQKASRRTVFTLESLPRPFLSFGADVTFPYVKLIEAYLVGILFCCWYDYQERKGKKNGASCWGCGAIFTGIFPAGLSCRVCVCVRSDVATQVYFWFVMLQLFRVELFFFLFFFLVGEPFGYVSFLALQDMGLTGLGSRFDDFVEGATCSYFARSKLARKVLYMA